MKANGEGLMKMRFISLLFGLILSTLCIQARAQVLIIANPGVASSDVSKAELHDVFTGATSSLKGGVQVIPVLLKQCALNDEFLRLYIGKSDSGFRAGWRSILFSGQGVMPKTLDSGTAMVWYVAHTPGAIGYIGESTPHTNVKILRVR
jgi:ABC-type phosphate transport system substrate-binding protein